MKCVFRTEIKIEKGIPIPYIRKTFNDIWEKMDDGDSFTLQEESQKQAALNAGSRAGHKVTSQKIDGGYRVWLVEKKKADPSIK